MTKKERIEKLEKEVDELKKEIEMLKMSRAMGLDDTPKPYQPYTHYPNYPYISPPNMPCPTITWQGWLDKSNPLHPLYGRMTSGG